MKRWIPWLLLAAVVAGSLLLGARGEGGPETAASRARRLAAELRCPTCRSQSALESDAQVARAVRAEIRRLIDEGRTDAEIRAYFVDRYGRDILLRPEGRGVSALVWVLPVVAFVCALAGLVAAFRRWRPTGATVTEDDRRLVREAMGGRS